MQEYPVRSIVSEPFVHQLEVIEKTLIEVRNQPSSYYSRRNNRMAASQGQGGQSSQYYKYGNFYQQQHQQQHQQQPQQQQVSDWYRRDYKNGMNIPNINSGMGGSGGSGGASLGGNVMASTGATGLGSNGAFASTHSNESSGSVNVDSGMSSVGSLGMGAPTHVPQVFEDKYDDKYDARGFATFDPFEAEDYTKGGMFRPMFNSSNNILGSGFSGNSNIWGDTNKTMASDAAVWG